MPLVANIQDGELYRNLERHGAIMAPEVADRSEIRPARIGLLNLMPAPAMESTEASWLTYISRSFLQVEPVLLKFNSDVRERPGASRQSILGRYVEISEIIDEGLDGLIVTGDNKELDAESGGLLNFNKLRYQQDLLDIINWANSNVPTTIYSCLASHFALKEFYGLERKLRDKKAFGVFGHEVLDKMSPIVRDMNDTFTSPHSRWGEIPTEDLVNSPANLVISSKSIGWLLAEAANDGGGTDYFLQGHPEYGRQTLAIEHQRNCAKDKDAPIPKNYFKNDDVIGDCVDLSWANDARSLLGNWMKGIYDRYQDDAY